MQEAFVLTEYGLYESLHLEVHHSVGKVQQEALHLTPGDFPVAVLVEDSTKKIEKN